MLCVCVWCLYGVTYHVTNTILDSVSNTDIYFNTPLSQCFIDDVTISLKGLEAKLVVISDYIQTCLETVCMLIKCCAILCIQLL